MIVSHMEHLSWSFTHTINADQNQSVQVSYLERLDIRLSCGRCISRNMGTYSVRDLPGHTFCKGYIPTNVGHVMHQWRRNMIVIGGAEVV